MKKETFLDAKDKQQFFLKELKLLLKKYDAELIIEDFGRDWSIDDKIVVQFAWDEELSKLVNDGRIPDLVLGTYASGDQK